MAAFSVYEVKENFDAMLHRVQHEPIQIRQNGKSVAVLVSWAEYEYFAALKLKMLQSRVALAKGDIEAGRLTDGETFFDELL